MRSLLLPASAELAREAVHPTARACAVIFCMTGLLLVVGARTAWADGAPPYETVVTTPPRTSGNEDDAASVSVVTTDRTPRSAETLPQLLSELPGLYVTRLGGLGSRGTLSIRGSAANQVQVYLDGVPLSSATWGDVDVGGVAVADVERIEVYRGMSPLSFGASALGGIVSITSREPRVSGAEARIGGGSFGTRFGGGEMSWAGRRVRLLASANHLASEGNFDYPSDNGTAFDPSDDRTVQRENNSLAQTDALIRALVPLDGVNVLTSLSFLDREQGVPAFAIFRSYQASLGTRRFLGSVTFDAHEALGAGAPLRVTAYGSATEQQFRDPLAEIAYTPTHTHDRSTAAGATITGRRPVSRWLTLSAVADGRYEQFSPFDELGTTPTAAPGRRAFGAVGTEAHTLLGRSGVELLPSVRMEVARDEIIDRGLFGNRLAEARTTAYLLPIARLAVIDRPRPWLALRANIARFARLPTMFERYGNTGTVLGNPQLRPESGINADVGATANWGSPDETGLTADAALFGSRVSDLIEMKQGRDTQRARNIGEALIGGAELSLAARYTRYARFVGQSTFTDARDVSIVDARRGHQLPHRPRLRAYARPELRRLPLGFGWQLGIYGDADVTGGNYLDPANLVAVPARVMFGAGASADSPRNAWRLVASALNVGDIHVVDLAGFPLPGRSFFLTLQWCSSANRTNKENVP